MENTYILIIGFPGVGKYTVAQELEKKIPNCKVIDNHYINNPLFNLISDEMRQKQIPSGFWANTMKIWDAVLEVVRDYSPREYNFILTGFCVNEQEDIDFFNRQVEIVNHRGGTFLPVVLTCDDSVYKQRALDPKRNERKKLTKWDMLEKLKAGKEIFIPDHPNLLQIETTALSPAQTADIILQRAQELIKTRQHQPTVTKAKDRNNVPK